MFTYEDMTISVLSERYRKKELSPVEVAEYALKRSHQGESTVNAFVCYTEERAMQEAKAAETAFMKGTYGPLTGIPYNVKDLIDVRGVATTMACEAYRDNIADKDAVVVDRLSRAGAVLLGKTNTMQIALGITTDISCFGATRNPRNLKHVSGGSSGGSAASVVGGMSAFSIGTDQGGSGRTPAAFSGVVGLKPTLGLISYRGGMAAQDLVDHMALLCRSSKDCAAILNICAGYDPAYEYSYKTPEEDYSRLIGESLKGKNFVVPMSLCEKGTNPFIYDRFCHALEVFRDLGANVKEITFSAEEVEALKAYRVAHQQLLLAGSIYHNRKVLDETPELIAEEIRERMKAGEIEGWVYYKNLQLRKKAMALFEEKMKGADLLLTPGPQIFAPEINQRIVNCDGEEVPIYGKTTQFVWPGNFLGIPCLSEPTGYNQDGLPSAMYLYGRRGSEASVLQASAAYEAAVGIPPLPNVTL